MEPASSSVPVRGRGAALAVAGFAAAQVAIVLGAANGPFFDEGIYATAGLRVLQGHGLADGYASWFNGSPFLWPVFSAAGYAVAGIEGARLVALAFSVVTLVAVARATRSLFGPRAAVAATVGLGLNGLFAALAHFAVYDVVALACLGVSFWLVTRHLETRDTAWLIAAGLSFSLAVIAKFGTVVMAPPLLGLLAFGAAPSRRPRAVLLFGGVAGTALLGYLLSPVGRVVPAAIRVYTDTPNPWTLSWAAPAQAYFLAVPLLLAVPGAWLVWQSGRRALCVALGTALFIAPAYHLLSLKSVSVHKHVVMGFLFAYPLAGVALERLRSSRPWPVRAVVWAALAGWGALQWYRQEHSWPDLRPASAYLVEHVVPGDALAAYNQSWTLACELYWRGRIDTPFSVDDQWSRGRSRSDLCSYDFLVGEAAGWHPEGDPFLLAGRACGLERVFTSTSRTYHVGPWGSLRSGTAELSVFRNPRTRPPATR